MTTHIHGDLQYEIGKTITTASNLASSHVVPRVTIDRNLQAGKPVYLNLRVADMDNTTGGAARTSSNKETYKVEFQVSDAESFSGNNPSGTAQTTETYVVADDIDPRNGTYETSWLLPNLATAKDFMWSRLRYNHGGTSPSAKYYAYLSNIPEFQSPEAIKRLAAKDRAGSKARFG